MRNISRFVVRSCVAFAVVASTYLPTEFLPVAEASKGCAGTPAVPPPPPPPAVIPPVGPGGPTRPPGVPANCGGYGACAGSCDAYTTSLTDGSSQTRRQELLDALMECLNNGIDNNNPDYRPGWYPKAPPPPPPPPTPPVTNPPTRKPPGGGSGGTASMSEASKTISSNISMDGNAMMSQMVSANVLTKFRRIEPVDEECYYVSEVGQDMLRGGGVSPDYATFVAHSVLRTIISSRLGIPESNITWNADIYNDLGATPNDVFAIRDAFQAREGIVLSDAMVVQLRTLGDLWNVIWNYNHTPYSPWW